MHVTLQDLVASTRSSTMSYQHSSTFKIGKLNYSNMYRRREEQNSYVLMKHKVFGTTAWRTTKWHAVDLVSEKIQRYKTSVISLPFSCSVWSRSVILKTGNFFFSSLNINQPKVIWIFHLLLKDHADAAQYDYLGLSYLTYFFLLQRSLFQLLSKPFRLLKCSKAT